MTFLLSLIAPPLIIIFALSKTPLIIAFMVLAIALMVSFFTFIYLPTSWFSFILFLIFIGAMIIIFIYVSSLASNDFTLTSMTPSWLLILSLSLTGSLILFAGQDYTSHASSSAILDFRVITPIAYKLYSPYVLYMSLFIIIYLLVALIVVAKNSSWSSGALRALKP